MNNFATVSFESYKMDVNSLGQNFKFNGKKYDKGREKMNIFIVRSLLALYVQRLIKISDFIIVPCPEKPKCFLLQ